MPQRKHDRGACDSVACVRSLRTLQRTKTRENIAGAIDQAASHVQKTLLNFAQDRAAQVLQVTVVLTEVHQGLVQLLQYRTKVRVYVPVIGRMRCSYSDLKVSSM